MIDLASSCMSAFCRVQLGSIFERIPRSYVAANHENDTCFGSGLVMGSADCINYAGLVKTPEKFI